MFLTSMNGSSKCQVLLLLLLMMMMMTMMVMTMVMVVMQNMLSHHHGNATDRDVIAEALSAMKSVTENINELKREHERSLRAVEIQSLLDGWSSIDLALLGQLVMEVITL